MRFFKHVVLAALVALLAGCATAPPPPPPVAHHPAYLRALSDLRAARWMIEHRPGDWQRTNDEAAAVGQIDAAIGDLRQAAYDDGKNLNDHPPVEEIGDHRGRLHAALDYMRHARSEISSEEDNGYANGLRGRAIGHIDGAINATKAAVGA